MVGCLLSVDGAAQTASMSFTLNGKDMGVAFSGVNIPPAADNPDGVSVAALKVTAVSQPKRATWFVVLVRLMLAASTLSLPWCLDFAFFLEEPTRRK